MGLLQVLSKPPEEVAPLLLGATLKAASGEGTVSLRIVEVEAYAGERDPASHAYNGLSKRTAPMFGPPGTLYVYRSYGMHWCLNIVCDMEGTAAGVLLRAAEVTGGEDIIVARRTKNVPTHKLAAGPGNLAAAIGATGADSGSILGEKFSLELAPAPITNFLVGPRIGISKAQTYLWRFALPSKAVFISKSTLTFCQ